MTDVTPTPHELRVMAREQTYANVTTERATVAAVDQLVFDKVRTWEQAVVAAADDFASNATDDMTAAQELGWALAEEVRQALNRGADPADLAKRFEELRRDAETALAALEKVEREAAWHEEKCRDPYTGYSTLMARYPTLRPALAL